MKLQFCVKLEKNQPHQAPFFGWYTLIFYAPQASPVLSPTQASGEDDVPSHSEEPGAGSALVCASVCRADDAASDSLLGFPEDNGGLGLSDDNLVLGSLEGNLFGLPEGTVQNDGALLIAGGGRLPDAIYDEFVRLAGGTSARIVLVPSAYPYRGMPHIRRAFNGWTEYRVKAFDFLHTDDPELANTAEFLKPIEEATGVWFAGGGQERLTYRYGGTLAAEAIRRVMVRGGVVGGTSAGASVLSEHMIRYGSRTEAVMAQGLGLTTRLVIDQHFSERGRFPRLLGVLEEQPGSVGLGVDEETAVILQGNRLRVMGKGRAALFVPPTQPNGATAVYRLRTDESAEAVLMDPNGRAIGFDVHKK